MLSCAVLKLQTVVPRTRKHRRAQVEPQLNLLEPLTSPGAVPLWDTLDETARVETVRLVARLIAKAVAPTDEVALASDAEQTDE